jgi:hypothetical protein
MDGSESDVAGLSVAALALVFRIFVLLTMPAGEALFQRLMPVPPGATTHRPLGFTE